MRPTCGTVVVPGPGLVPALHGTDVHEHLLARDGHAVDLDGAGLPPEVAALHRPGDFEPYPVGYVELPGEVKVETRSSTSRPTSSHRHADGAGHRPVHARDRRRRSLTFAFRPAADPKEPTNE